MWSMDSATFPNVVFFARSQQPLVRPCFCSSSPSSTSSLSNRNRNRNPRLCNAEKRKLFVDPRCISRNGDQRSRLFAQSPSAFETQSLNGTVAGKVRRMASEFESLREPIDRVKRLLDYAALLPEFDDSERVPSNRVHGCAVQVWLCVRMDECGTMRFSADSDSEITRGFCSCLVWILDGASPEEVLMVEVGDLEALNVGEHGRAHSRVNTWHNVLIDMQKRTKVVVAEAEGKPVFDPFMNNRRRDFKERGLVC